jgi:6-phosphogluconolactonase
MAADRMSAAAVPQERTFATPDELARDVADWIVARACAVERRFAVCLSGGSTPKRLYERLAAPALVAKFPWQRTHWFWGDERFVSYDDEQSNFGMVREALLRHALVPPDNIHPIPTAGRSPAACAAEYEAVLQRFYGTETFGARPLFDLTLLGLGENGHIASLFPGSSTLTERKRWVLPVVGESSVDRITLTYPALERSVVVAFLVVGEGKREVLARVRGGDLALPAARLRPAGEVYWFTDRAARGSGVNPSPPAGERALAGE